MAVSDKNGAKSRVLPGGRGGARIMLRVCVIRGVMWVMIKYAAPGPVCPHYTKHLMIKYRGESRAL